MSINIESPNDKRLAEVPQVRVHGLPGVGSYTLVVNVLLLIFPPKSETSLQHVAIRLDWGDSTQRMIGTAIPEEAQPIRITEHTNNKQLNFRLCLTPSQIEAIEVRRNGGDFKLSIWFTCEVVQGDARTTATQNGEYVIPQQEWIEALDRMEYRTTLLYEITLPESSGENVSAAEIIKKAQRHLLSGHYDECVGECRKLLEAYPLSQSNALVFDSARKKYKGDRTSRESMDVFERFMIMRDSLNHTINLAHHHSPGCNYSRDQARAILGASVLLFNVTNPGN